MRTHFTLHSLRSLFKKNHLPETCCSYVFLEVYKNTNNSKYVHRAIQFVEAYANNKYRSEMRVPDRLVQNKVKRKQLKSF